MPMVHPCIRPGCGTLTMGEYCLDHERQEDLRVEHPGKDLAWTDAPAPVQEQSEHVRERTEESLPALSRGAES